MEYIRKGAVMSRLYWKFEDAKNPPANKEDANIGLRVLSEEKALINFRGLILGLDYSKHLVICCLLF